MNIPVTTLDYWRWKKTGKTRLVEVAIEKEAPSSKNEPSPGVGLWVCSKRLEKGRFQWPAQENTRSVTVRAEELAMLINGLDLKQTKPRDWYRRSA